MNGLPGLRLLPDAPRPGRSHRTHRARSAQRLQRLGQGTRWHLRPFIPVTNAIEALNRQLRKAIKTKGHFPNEDAARKLIYLAIQTPSRNGPGPGTGRGAAGLRKAVKTKGHFPPRTQSANCCTSPSTTPSPNGPKPAAGRKRCWRSRSSSETAYPTNPTPPTQLDGHPRGAAERACAMPRLRQQRREKAMSRPVEKWTTRAGRKVDHTGVASAGLGRVCPAAFRGASRRRAERNAGGRVPAGMVVCCWWVSPSVGRGGRRGLCRGGGSCRL